MPPSEIDEWVDEAKPLDVREQYERQIKELQEAYGEAMLELRARKKAGVPARRGRQVIETIRQGLAEDGFKHSPSALLKRIAVDAATGPRVDGGRQYFFRRDKIDGLL